jgi:hypothetical protein
MRLVFLIAAMLGPKEGPAFLRRFVFFPLLLLLCFPLPPLGRNLNCWGKAK